MQLYDFRAIEEKWQQYWRDNNTFQVEDASSGKPKFFALIEFPYPSGAGLHVGHPRSYTALDVVVRKRRMQGYNVLYPMGWDAFGLPTENYAIKTGRQPADVTAENEANFRRQLQALGFSFDWSREIDTTDPKYYKWTQWIFLQLFKKGLAYKANIPINWCPKDKIGLANEEVVDGACERCGTAVEKRDKEQWMLAITKYADRLLADLDTVDYIPAARVQQTNWIGKSEGIIIEYQVVGSDAKLACFTTTPVNFGATFVVISPEHPEVAALTTAEHRDAVAQYVEAYKKKKSEDRFADDKEKSGVFTGSFVKNHVTGESIPVWVADFVLMTVGTGAVQGCPGHDMRDFEFATKYGLPIRRVVVGEDGDTSPIERPEQVVEKGAKGVMINSDFLNGIEFAEAMDKTMDYFEQQGWGKRTVQYKLRDWVFSRQRYWGEPIPLVHCEPCGGWVALPEEQLPLTLPHVEKYQPTDTGESPLSTLTDWVKTTCPQCGGPARRETDTMPNWAGSSWYFLRYCAPQDDAMFTREKAWIRPSIELVQKDKDIWDAYLETRARFDAAGIEHWVCGTLAINGLNRAVWMHMNDADVVVRREDFERARALVTNSELVHIIPSVGDALPTDYEQVHRCALYGTTFRMISPRWHVGHYATRNKNELDALKREFLAAYQAEPVNYWMGVDWYNGGMEHTVLHLLYSRFWNKFLFDIGASPVCEPYNRRTSHGLILAKGGEKMSKSKGNVVNPDDLVAQYGADTFRAYEMFMGPFDQHAQWDTDGLVGVHRFLTKFTLISEKVSDGVADRDLLVLMHQTIKRVGDAIEGMRFNTAVAALMEYTNALNALSAVPTEAYRVGVQMLAPYAPHLAEELWSALGNTTSVAYAAWPTVDEQYLVRDEVTYAVQVSGKLRASFVIAREADEATVREAALTQPAVQKWLEGKTPTKVIVIKGKMVSIVL